jgi:hypothetical protein
LIAPIVIGTLAGSAGGGILFPILVNGMLQKDEDKVFSTHFFDPSYTFFSPFILSAFYFVSKYLYGNSKLSFQIAGADFVITPELVIKLGIATTFFLIWVNTRLASLFSGSPKPKRVEKAEKPATKPQPEKVEPKKKK